jgi:hypothetical protein
MNNEEGKKGRKKKEWASKASSTREKEVSYFWSSEEMKDIMKVVMNKVEGSLKRKGIPLDVLEMNVMLKTSTLEMRKRKFQLRSTNDELELTMDQTNRSSKEEKQRSLQEEDDHHDLIKKTAFYCTKHNISTRARDGLLSACNSAVTGREVKEMLKKIDNGMESFLPLKLLQGSDCAYFPPMQLLELVVRGSGYEKPELEVVFSGDGRNIRKVSSIAFFLKFNIDELDSRKTKWVFPIVIGKGKEKAENMEEMMKLIGEEMSQINGHIVHLENGKQVKICLKVCADGKFLLSILGMKGANGNMSCPFCMLRKDQWALALFSKFNINVHDFRRKS